MPKGITRAADRVAVWKDAADKAFQSSTAASSIAPTPTATWLSSRRASLRETGRSGVLG